jgi:hypothetical protein
MPARYLHVQHIFIGFLAKKDALQRRPIHIHHKQYSTRVRSIFLTKFFRFSTVNRKNNIMDLLTGYNDRRIVSGEKNTTSISSFWFSIELFTLDSRFFSVMKNNFRSLAFQIDSLHRHIHHLSDGSLLQPFQARIISLKVSINKKCFRSQPFVRSWVTTARVT